MKMAPANQSSPIRTQVRGVSVIKVLALVSVVFVIGLAAGAYWYHRSAKPIEPGTPTTTQTQPTVLSDATLTVLSRLNGPLEVRFHSVLGESRAAESWKPFAVRVSDLLAEFERAGGGRVIVKRFDTRSKSEAKAVAMADGLEPFNLDKREIGYLGIAVSYGDQKICLPRLNSDWEAALEFDLGRAIARAAGAGASDHLVVNPAAVDTAATEEVMEAIPNLTSLSLPEAKQQLSDAAREEFKAAVAQMQRQMAVARETFSANSEDPQIAAKALQQFQAEQSGTLDKIPRRLQARITALERLKGMTVENSQPPNK